MDTTVAFGQLLIDDRWVPGEGDSITSHDPATGEVIWEGRSASAAQVRDAVQAATDAAPGWARMSYDERLARLAACRDMLTAHQSGLTSLISRETGKPLWDARQELRAMIGRLTMADSAYRDRCTDRDRSINTEGGIGMVRWRPHGVVAVITPHTRPADLAFTHIVPALLAGNTVVYKPSEWTPVVGQCLAQVFHESGLPTGVVNVLLGDGDVGRQLVDDPRIGAVCFTGRTETGLALRRQLVDRPNVMLTAEMGGNNPIVAWDVPDPAVAAAHIAISAWQSAGQHCSCARRLIVRDGEDGDAVVRELVALTTHMRVGPPTPSVEPFMGPLISPAAADAVLQAQARLISSGADVILKARRVTSCRAMLVPGLLDVSRMSVRHDEEVFGPLLQVVRVPNFDAAIAEANNSRFGLTAGLLCPSRQRFQQFAAEVRAGVFLWNRPTVAPSRALPFGGRGLSGNHRPGGFLAADYCSVATAMTCIERLDPPQLPPGIATD